MWCVCCWCCVLPRTERSPFACSLVRLLTRSTRFYQKYQELRARIKANSCPVLPATPITSGMSGSCGVINNVGISAASGARITSSQPSTPTMPPMLAAMGGSQSYLVQRSASLKDHRQLRYGFVCVCMLKWTNEGVLYCVSTARDVMCVFIICLLLCPTTVLTKITHIA